MNFAEPSASEDAKSATLAPQLVADAALLEPGQILDERVVITEMVGRGSMGVVYKAEQAGVDRPVAVKTLHVSHLYDKEQVARFYREAKLISGLDHPNIVKIFAIGVTPAGQPYIVLDYIEGRTLADELAAGGVSTLGEFCDIFSQVLSALTHAHERGVVHRDIKPRNILLQDENGVRKVYLVDFGIAKLADEEADQKLTRTGAIVGSPVYMSPEQCMGKSPDPRSDIYSLACVMYEALTGKPPFNEETAAELLHAHLLNQAESLKNRVTRFAVPDSLCSMIELCLQKVPESRYQTAAAMLTDLKLIASGEPTITIKKVKPSKQTKAKVNKRLAYAVIIAGVVLACAGIGFGVSWYFHKKDTERKDALIDQAQRLVKSSIPHRWHHKYKEADDELSRAWELFKQTDYKGHQLADLCLDRARVNNGMQAYALADSYFKKALELRRENNPANLEGQAEVYAEWGQSLSEANDYARAKAMLTEAEKFYRTITLGENERTKHYILLLQGLIHADLKTYQYEDSLQYFQKLIEAKKAYRSSGWEIADTVESYAKMLRQVHSDKEADEQERIAKEIRAKADREE